MTDPGRSRYVVELLGGRWTLAVLSHLAKGDSRYQDLHDALDGISYKVLTETLRRAERDRLVSRRLDDRRIETATLYELTDLGGFEGQTLAPSLATLRAERCRAVRATQWSSCRRETRVSPGLWHCRFVPIAVPIVRTYDCGTPPQAVAVHRFDERSRGEPQ